MMIGNLSGTVTNIYKQIGNAVPVEFARNIGQSIIEALNEGEKVWEKASGN